MIEQNQQAAVETSIINMTPTAADKVHELLAQENDPSLGLRIFVAGGGCSGLQYGMTLDEEQEGDTVINPNAVSSCGCGHSFKTAGGGAGEARSCGCGH